MTGIATAAGRPQTEDSFFPINGMALAEAGQRSLAAASEAQRHALERAGRVNDEGLRFMAQRLEENRRALGALAGCKGLPEALSVWSEYVDTAARQYSDEFGLMAGLCSDQLREAVEDVQHEAAEMLGRSVVVPVDPVPADSEPDAAEPAPAETAKEAV
jgi:hypothetical protein